MFNFQAIWELLKSINYKKLGKGAVDFARRNESTIVSSLATIGEVAVAGKYGVDIRLDNPQQKPKSNVIDYERIMRLESPKYAAISSITNSAMASYYASDHKNAIKNIKDIVMDGTDIPNSTVSYAIECIDKISRKSYYSDVKSLAQNAIHEIGKR